MKLIRKLGKQYTATETGRTCSVQVEKRTYKTLFGTKVEYYFGYDILIGNNVLSTDNDRIVVGARDFQDAQYRVFKMLGFNENTKFSNEQEWDWNY